MKISSALLSIAAVVNFAVPASVLGADVKMVHVELKDAKGEKVGMAMLSPVEHGVKIKLHVKGLTPGKHGIHIHEKGVCTGPDFKSAGGHLNPEHKEHGLKNPNGAHAGDMPNIEASRSGTVHTELVAPGVTLEQGPNSLLREGGTALVIHAKADDQHSNPAGDAGDRVVCGVIAAQ